MKNIIIFIISIIGFIFCEEKNTAGIWFREIPHPQTGVPITLELDMKYGYAVADNETIYIIVNDRKTGQEIKMAFINGDYFTTHGSYWYPGSFEAYSNHGECIGEDIQSKLKKGKPLEKK